MESSPFLTSRRTAYWLQGTDFPKEANKKGVVPNCFWDNSFSYTLIKSPNKEMSSKLMLPTDTAAINPM